MYKDSIMYPNNKPATFFSVKQVAEYLQLHEKKVYQLVNEGKIPGTKVTGKWLFPRELVDQWLLESSHGGVLTDRLVIVGSDDPLLYRLVMHLTQEIQDKALISYTSTGTQLGLSLLSQRKADVCGIHWGPVEESHVRHPALLQAYPAHTQWVLVRAFEREQGLIVSPEIYQQYQHNVAALLKAPIRWGIRQEGAGSQRFLLETLSQHHVELAQLQVQKVAYSERDAAAYVATKQVDIAPGSHSAAAEFGLKFLSMGWEGFDLAINRNIYFRTLFQRLTEYMQGAECKHLLGMLKGYRVERSGEIISPK